MALAQQKAQQLNRRLTLRRRQGVGIDDLVKMAVTVLVERGAVE